MINYGNLINLLDFIIVANIMVLSYSLPLNQKGSNGSIDELSLPHPYGDILKYKIYYLILGLSSCHRT